MIDLLAIAFLSGVLFAQWGYRHRDRVMRERAPLRFVDHCPVEHRIRCMEGR